LENNILESDLNYIFDMLNPLWENLRNKNIFLTGGTGFFGCWFLESFIWVMKKLNLNANLTVLTRDIDSFKRKYPKFFQYPFLHFHQGDIKDFIFLENNYDFFIHAAADIQAFYSGNAIQGFETIIQGTSRILEFSKKYHIKNILFVSTGAVYGKLPDQLSYIREDYHENLMIDDPKSIYGIAKKTAEHLCYLYYSCYQLNVKIARCFTFIGPYLPLDGHFALSSFLKSVLSNTSIVINNPKTLYRSYLYASDLMVWLWKILFCGKACYPYNVGSDKSLSLQELANLIVKITKPNLKVIHNKSNKDTSNLHEYYIPDLSRSREELCLTENMDLIKAIRFTFKWYEQNLLINSASTSL
jgi:nucleoside-diphosphate-sugar epimerase